MMTGSGLEKLLIDELKDLYDAEHKILKALPKMAKAADSPDLRTAFEEHRVQTEGQVKRLDRAFKLLDLTPKAKPCHGMQGLLEEGEEIMGDEESEGATLDAGLIGAAQKVEHYEIAAYGTAKCHAQLLDMDGIAKLLDETLEEEKETDERLSELAGEINVEADEVNAVRGNGSSNGRKSNGRKKTRRARASH